MIFISSKFKSNIRRISTFLRLVHCDVQTRFYKFLKLNFSIQSDGALQPELNYIEINVIKSSLSNNHFEFLISKKSFYDFKYIISNFCYKNQCFGTSDLKRIIFDVKFELISKIIFCCQKIPQNIKTMPHKKNKHACLCTECYTLRC